MMETTTVNLSDVWQLLTATAAKIDRLYMALEMDRDLLEGKLISPPPARDAAQTWLREIVRQSLHEELDVWRSHTVENVTPTSTLGAVLESEFFGMWRERTDLPDSPALARTLRAQAWERGV